jgi:hypothetical protein
MEVSPTRRSKRSSTHRSSQATSTAQRQDAEHGAVKRLMQGKPGGGGRGSRDGQDLLLGVPFVCYMCGHVLRDGVAAHACYEGLIRAAASAGGSSEQLGPGPTVVKHSSHPVTVSVGVAPVTVARAPTRGRGAVRTLAQAREDSLTRLAAPHAAHCAQASQPATATVHTTEALALAKTEPEQPTQPPTKRLRVGGEGAPPDTGGPAPRRSGRASTHASSKATDSALEQGGNPFRIVGPPAGKKRVKSAGTSQAAQVSQRAPLH